ncbi:MAG TPA: lysylphosphatidylglycerol synthase transmembrane domain-containing protein [Sandaracinaceae bacterium LLY-WYZ-13_1]|nr:lysylphosphatidylglycerol synthase transmembrane domain-containing protein [Sandaracinaceae bacterium LLY-WYZ-13_1]
MEADASERAREDGDRSRTKKTRRRRWLRVGFGLAGLTAASVLVWHVGPTRIGRALLRAAPWVPLALLLEGARLGVEAWATRRLYASLEGSLPRRAVLRAQLLAYPVFVLAPAGRAACEATKAGMLGGYVGRSRAAAVAAVGQAVALIGTALLSVICALAATFRPGAWDLAVAIWTQTAAVAVLGGVMLWAFRRRSVGRVVAKILGWAGVAEDQRQQFGHSVRALPPLPWPPTLGYFASRSLSAGVFFVLLVAVGAGPDPLAALRAMGVSLVGATAVDFVPADLGLTEGAFTLWASDVGVEPAQGVAIGVLFHVVQVTWVAIGAVAAFVWSAPPEEAR